jgi:uncharacterized protein (TIGR00304 family)
MLKRYLAVAGALFISGILMLVFSVMRGEGSAGFALFVPFFYGTGPFASLGVLLIFLGIVALFASFVRGAMNAMPDEEGEEDRERAGTADPAKGAPRKDEEAAAPQDKDRPDVRGGAVIMIGPIPIVFGSDRAAARNLMILALVIMFVALLVLGILAIR